MEFQLITPHLLKCIIPLKELEERKLTLDEIRSGSAAALDMITQMVEEGKEKVGFYPTGNTLTVSVMAQNEGGDVEIYIEDTKNRSAASNVIEDLVSSLLRSLKKEDWLSDAAKAPPKENDEEAEEAEEAEEHEKERKNPPRSERFFMGDKAMDTPFHTGYSQGRGPSDEGKRVNRPSIILVSDSLEDMIEASDSLKDYTFKSSLYKGNTRAYALKIRRGRCKMADFDTVIDLMSKNGTVILHEDLQKEEIIGQKCLIADEALTVLRSLKD